MADDIAEKVEKSSAEIQAEADKAFRVEQASIERDIRENPSAPIAKWADDRWVRYTEHEIAEIAEQARINEEFRIEQEAIEKEVRENSDKPVAERRDGVWHRLDDAQKEAWHQAEAKHASELPTKERARFLGYVDAMANDTRSLFATPSEMTIYSVKQGEASSLLGGREYDASSFPMLAGEAERTGKTPEEVAKIWDGKRLEWLAIASAVDRARMTAKEALAATDDVDAMQKAVDTYKESLMALVPKKDSA